MFFLDQNLTELMKESFAWDDDQIRGMNYLYFDSIFRLIINDTVEFLEVNEPEELTKLKILINETKSNNDPELQVNLLKFLFGLSDKYIKLQEHLKGRLNKLNGELIEDFINEMDYESGLKLLDIMDKEMTNINKFEKKFLKFAQEKEANPQ